jgi:hypothetical protein
MFRAYLAYLMARGRCEVWVASEGGKDVGFAIARRDGKAESPWLLSSIAVLPHLRRKGLSQALFGAVAHRPLRLTVEAGGPVAFYERLGLDRTGERTLIYFQKAQVAAFEKLPGWASTPASSPRARAVNRSAFLLQCETPGPDCAALARRKLRWFRWGILEIPRRVDVPAGLFPEVVYEYEFRTAAAPSGGTGAPHSP